MQRRVTDDAQLQLVVSLPAQPLDRFARRSVPSPRGTTPHQADVYEEEQEEQDGLAGGRGWRSCEMRVRRSVGGRIVNVDCQGKRYEGTAQSGSVS